MNTCRNSGINSSMTFFNIKNNNFILNYKNMHPGLFYSIYNHGLKYVSKRFNFGHKKCGLTLLKTFKAFNLIFKLDTTGMHVI